MLKARPALFHAGVGTAHLVSHADLKVAYEATLTRARAVADKENAGKLELMGSPPWTNPRHFGVMRRAMRKYENAVTDPAPKAWWLRAPAYASARDLADYEAGEEYSFIEFVGMKGEGMGSRIDLPALGTDFAMPVFMVQGAEDLLTRPEVTRAYFDRIQAPVKEYVLVQRTGHDPNPPMVDAQFRLLKESVAPLARD
jgi:pimeloyl-ACP methyl ester carboxylesterase